MQRDTVIIKPKIHLAMSMVLLPMIIVFFRPTLWELVGFFVVDSFCYIAMRPFEIPLFHRYFPKTRLFFPDVNPRLFDIQDFKERMDMYRAMAEFPRQRALYILAVSFIKVIPGFAYGLWVWSDHYTAIEIILKGFAVCAFTFSYGVGMGFLGYHNQVSETLEIVHRKSNWSEVFRAIDPLPNESMFKLFEVLAMLGVLVFWVGMICLIPFEGGQDSPWLSLLQILYLSGFGIYFVSQIHATSRRQVTQGLESLITYLSREGKPLDPRGLPLSTNPTLAFYQKTFNDLVERNVANEQEIHRWILRKAEDSRYLQLGRVTGLFIHDLATPLTIMGLSLTQLEEKPNDQAVARRYVERLRFCLQQISDFIGNLRLSLRDSTVNAHQASPYLAHQAATRMLSYLHERPAYAKLSLRCDVDPELRVSFPQPELNQIILNLYSNSVSNLLEHRVENPSLVMEFHALDAQHVDLIVRDNGTGLSLENFQFITEEAERLPGQEGIGLKLTKRLVELYGGSLNLTESEAPHGSAFVIRLQQAQTDFTPRDESRDMPGAAGIQKVEIARIPVEASQES
ncbi:sensor histidine kinase [Oligoflexus tunisiensis]|uniref:sensor histidine kinase n=1 Tax=Oligoflexus tunisiensis TaxID=708132 RepID=UPI00114C87CB|nr:HAMP domain-containing sensor histidine kinase [Oligoflexus tunisiensis]